MKRLVKENGIDSEFEIFADGIKRSYKAVAIEDFLTSIYEYRPIFSTDIFGWVKFEKTYTSESSFQKFNRRNLQIDFFNASNASWWNKQARQKIPWLQQVWALKIIDLQKTNDLVQSIFIHGKKATKSTSFHSHSHYWKIRNQIEKFPCRLFCSVCPIVIQCSCVNWLPYSEPGNHWPQPSCP